MCEVIHCDIKPENFIIDQNYQLRLIDFGMGMLAKNKK
jgi:serine/threonine protein kinase